MDMFFDSSGKEIFDYLPIVASETKIAKETLLKMLKAETDYRRSKEFQEQYSKKDEAEWLLSIETKIQLKVLKEFGFGEDSLEKYRAQRGLYDDDNDVKEAALYIKYDRSNKGTLNIGSTAPNCGLVTLENKKVKLHELAGIGSGKPCVIIAGSHT